MPGLRILNIHPRMAGPIARWSALFDLAAATGFNAVWLNPFHRTSEVPYQRRGEQRQRSLYAIADHRAFDQAVTSGDAAADRAALKAAFAHARKLGLRVMVDLVVNHVAVDHPLVLEEDARLAEWRSLPGARLVRPAENDMASYDLSWPIALGGPTGIEHEGQVLEFLFVRTESRDTRDGRLAAVDYEGSVGHDTAQIAFGSAAARRIFLGDDAAPGLWKQLIDEYLELGVGGFRCDMAHAVPASWWRELIAYARRRDPGVIFLAETLGGRQRNLELIDVRQPIVRGAGTGAEVVFGERPAFDLVMLSLSWWDMKSEWLFEEIALTHHLALHGGAAFPDSHDHEQTLAQRYRQQLRAAAAAAGATAIDELALQEVVAALCVRDYGVAALVGSSVIATLGYLFCLDQAGVFWDAERLERLARERQERADPSHPLNLGGRVATINEFLARLPLAEAKVELDGVPRPVSALDARWPSAVAARDWISFEVLLRHVVTGRPLGSIAVAVDRGYEVRGPRLERMLATIVAGPTPGLRDALCETSEESIEEQATASGQPAAPRTPPPVWLETPLLVACFRAQPASMHRGASARGSSGLHALILQAVRPSAIELLAARAIRLAARDKLEARAACATRVTREAKTAATVAPAAKAPAALRRARR